ncbi:tyrosine-protein phosphatase [Gorillibacterium timonense]|uniref:tyrosine-protein phosphatase n=1 Tax=Gorillibacterium timonense TaxID=1689269 RepID=UPI00071E2973|nr:CpsB/CapC family capsule biosynthesis tyrosine phosphatase [Gorillibacterium timonense]
MIDIHAHVLPFLDDGAADLHESLEMARMAVLEGIQAVIATPHHANGQFDNAASDVRKAVASLQDELEAHRIPLRLYPGQEIRGYSELLQDWERGALLTLADTSYLLLEFPSGQVPTKALEWIHELSISGITAIIAHPERNKELAGSPDTLAGLIEAGALAQVTSHSLTGAFGRSIQKNALHMCRSRLIHFVASDAHNVKQRPFALQEAFSLLKKEAGKEVADICRENAELLLSKESIPYRQPQLAKKRWSFFVK